MAYALTRAVRLYLTGRYPDDHRVPQGRASLSLLLDPDYRPGPTLVGVLEKAVLGRSLARLRLLAPEHHQALTSGVLTPGVAQRFWRRVQIEPSGCWRWTGSVQGGYGALRVGERYEAAHRVSYALEHGVLPAQVRHTCENPLCVNPAHLEGLGDYGHLPEGYQAALRALWQVLLEEANRV